MCLDREQELPVADLEQFELLVVGAREEQLAVEGEAEGPHWGRVALDDLRMTLYGVVPQPDCVVC